MRLVAIGDVGVIDDMIHIGDEAMFEQFVDRMRARGITEVVGLSSAPAETAARYGIDAAPQIGFDARSGRAAMAERLDRVRRTAAGQAGLLAAGDPAHEVIAAVSAADGVVVTGGGNLASTWPANIMERVAVGQVAAAFGKPLVVTGQTLGPDLSAGDAAAVAGLLAAARLVGVREQPSYELARSLGVDGARLARNVDDAAFLASPHEDPQPVLAVSLSTHVGAADRGTVAKAAADLVDALCGTAGLGVRFVPHFASLDPTDRRGDSALHDLVHAALSTPQVSHVTPVDSRQVAAASRSAAVVLSSRYHPAVFATSAGVPTLAVSVDGYTSVKLTGATGAFGQSGVVAVEDLLSGAATATAAALWDRREGIREHGLRIAEQQRPVSEAWWDRVAETLSARERPRRAVRPE